ncbi:hypothetical protein ACFOQM_11250 [Paenibacillus sp. GCM10012307]|uniref:Uncharacterized protein n=1 Tax=Paenibacillus roseus TaxID=2798579 RepID=A0A934J313_9BACL|nr:hypothetical protein [Paenibacillus roseus]MBJ6361860.1 hypothetical protein [Paenibacillus roseus]
MLKVRGIVNTIYTESIEIDTHIPFNIEWKYEVNRNSKNYWRTGDFKQTLFTIGLDSSSGLIQDMTLTSANLILIDEEDCLSTNYTEMGVPEFELSQWNSSDCYIDFLNDFKVQLKNNGLSICMAHDQVELVIKSGRVVFHIGQEQTLLGIDLIELTKDEYQRLKMSLVSL